MKIHFKWLYLKPSENTSTEEIQTLNQFRDILACLAGKRVLVKKFDQEIHLEIDHEEPTTYVPKSKF
jgi:hypothetical protein